ncbi:MAG: hypothetical protein GY713_14795 [Actinomycetia bacterium]|nr:hypothetical protein [Actinomycetes bacterium]
MVCVDFVADSDTGRRCDDGVDVGKWVANEAEARGLIVRPVGDQNVMSPSLVITKDEVDSVVSIPREAILEARKGLEDAGHH